MYEFTLDLVSRGEDLTSTRILLETEWPELADRVDLVLLKHITSKGVDPQTITPTVGPEDDTAEEAIGRLLGRTCMKALTS